MPVRSKFDNLQQSHVESLKLPVSPGIWDWNLMTVEATFSKTSDSVALARRFAEEVLGGVPASIALDIVLMVSELATNAVVHAATMFRLSIERTHEFVRVEVVDGGDGHPRLQTPSNSDLHGRGLQLVQRLSDQWGAIENDGRKIVWFVRRLALPDAGRAGNVDPATRPRSKVSASVSRPERTSDRPARHLYGVP